MDGDVIMGMFHFSEYDDVQINQLVLNYSYDMTLCYYSYDITDGGFADIDGIDSAQMYECPHPMILIHNSGRLQMSGLEINTFFSDFDIATNQKQFWFEYVGEYGFIHNLGVMVIDTVTIQNTLGRHMFYNELELTMNHLVFAMEDEDIFNVNDLNSRFIVRSEGVTSSLIVTESQFQQSYVGIRISGGALNVSNSSFQYLSYPISIGVANSVFIEDSSFTHFGQFYGPYLGLEYDGGITVHHTKTVHISNGKFVGYNAEGLVRLTAVDTVILSGNTFKMDPDGILYDVDPYDVGFFSAFSAVLFQSCDVVKVTANTFLENDIDVNTPWIHFGDSQNMTCLSGNRFAFSLCSKLCL